MLGQYICHFNCNEYSLEFYKIRVSWKTGSRQTVNWIILSSWTRSVICDEFDFRVAFLRLGILCKSQEKWSLYEFMWEIVDLMPIQEIQK